MALYVLSPEAHEDLRELRVHIAQDEPTGVRRVLNELREAMPRLAQLRELPVSAAVRDVTTTKHV